MGRCKYYEVCGLEDSSQPDNYLCILHSPDLNKNQKAFNNALEAHRRKEERFSNFERFVFPSEAHFERATFPHQADFSRAVFSKGASFEKAVFEKGANFTFSNFIEESSFSDATFTESTWFTKTVFGADANFIGARFSRRSYFQGAKFQKTATFSWANFAEEARFRQTEFKSDIDFSQAIFSGLARFSEIIFPDTTLFTGTKFAEQASFHTVIFKNDSDFTEALFNKGGEFYDTHFASVKFTRARFYGPTTFDASDKVSMFDGEVLFTQTIIDPGDSVKFIEADLPRCRFLGTDVRKVHFIGVTWACIGARNGVYDEITPLQPGEQRQWAQIEELYRQLKQNYEERRDYERAGHFHIGEKEMRLKNPDTPRHLRFLLWLYKWVSGYGEHYRLPLIWLAGLWLLTSCTALVWGLTMGQGAYAVRLSPNSSSHWGWALLYGLETMFHLPAREFTPTGLGRAIHTFASILGPVFIGMFGLALRQRLKR